MAAGSKLELDEPAQADDLRITRAGPEGIGRRVRLRNVPGQRCAFHEQIDSHAGRHMAESGGAGPLETVGRQPSVEAAARVGFNQDIEVFRRARVAVVDDRNAADDAERDTRFREQLAQLTERDVDGGKLAVHEARETPKPGQRIGRGIHRTKVAPKRPRAGSTARTPLPPGTPRRRCGTSPGGPPRA